MGKDLWHKRLDDFESFDRITFEVVPRYKTSGLSGDEWRQHVAIKFWFKGECVHESGYRDMQAALAFAPSEWIKAQEPIPMRVIELEKQTCDQPSCTNTPVGRLEIKQEFERGHKLDASETRLRTYRQFCKKHIRRGDCSREDSDDNYTPLDNIGPEASTNMEESPSSMMSVEVGSIDDIPEALRNLKPR